MKLIEGVDYWVRQVEFPNMGSPSVVASNGDGTFTIYLNTCFSPETRAEGLRHELAHLSGDHFYRDELELGAIEDAADGLRRIPAAADGSAQLPPGLRFRFTRTPATSWRISLRGASPRHPLRSLREAGLLPCEAGDASH